MKSSNGVIEQVGDIFIRVVNYDRIVLGIFYETDYCFMSCFLLPRSERLS